MKNKILLLGLLLYFLNSWSQAQHILPQDVATLTQMEDSLKTLSRQMIFDEDNSKRFAADNNFIRHLVQALKVPNSFYYPFDSIVTVSKLYPADSTFRIFTWQFQRDETYFRQRGAIQMKTADGSLKLFPLIDNSDFTDNPTDSVRGPNSWIGAIYYNIVEKNFNNKKYYTLLGYDDNNEYTTKKWIEVLTFDNMGNPQFGGKFFNYPEDSIKPAQPAYRFCLEYKKDGRARLNYDPDMDLIVFEHLISESNNYRDKSTLIPDGDYEAFKWEKGKWNYIEKIFTQKLEDGQAPVPAPIKDKAGKSDEQKLLEQSMKNMEKEQAQKQKQQLQKNQKADPRQAEEY